MSNHTEEQKEFMLEQMRLVAQRLDETPTIREWIDAELRPSPATYVNAFGTWNKALAEAGLACRKGGGRINLDKIAANNAAALDALEANR